MAEKTVMLVCAAGLSTSMIVAKMKSAAETVGKDYNIFATAASDADNKISEENPDVLLLGPQVKYMFADFKKKATVPVEVIDMDAYSSMDGAKVLAQAEELMGD